LTITRPSHGWLIAEWVGLFMLLPIAMWLWFPPHALLMTLVALALISLWLWKRTNKDVSIKRTLFDFKHIPHFFDRKIIIRFAVCAVLLTIFTRFYDPVRLLSFPVERTALWVMIMVFYPLFSVLPQEIIYRLFFFERYKSLFGSERMLILMSGIAFGHAHIMFNNWVAYSMSMVGGWIFAHTYSKTRSFPVVWLEHAIYGCFLFTIGLGWYFYMGAQR
jgi:hypothetical protein